MGEDALNTLVGISRLTWVGRTLTNQRNLVFRLELPAPVVYKGLKLDDGYRVDLLVAETVVVEVKSVEQVLPVHKAQLLTYLRLGGWKVGLLINFNVPLLRNGIVRRVMGLDE